MNHGDVTGSGRHDLDIWHVRLANGETRALSLDELSDAFSEGWVDERTLVLRAGALQWATLGEVAGLDAAPPPDSVVPSSIAPLSLDAYGTNSPFDIEVPTGAESDPEVLAFRPRGGKKILGVMTAMLVVAGLGFGAFRGAPLLQRTLASAGGGAKSAPAVLEAKPVAPVVTPAARAPVAPVAAAEAPATAAAAAIPTLDTTALPNAVLTPAEKKAAARAAKAEKMAAKKAAAAARRATKKKAPRKRAH